MYNDGPWVRLPRPGSRWAPRPLATSTMGKKRDAEEMANEEAQTGEGCHQPSASVHPGYRTTTWCTCAA